MSNYNPCPIYRASRTNPPSRNRFMDIRRMARNRLSAHPEDESIDPDKLSVLPDTAEALRKDTLERFGFNGTLEVLFAGTRDENSALAALREYESTVVREIYSYISNQWARHVKLTIPAALVGSSPWPLSGENVIMRFNHGRNGHENWSAREIEEGVSTTSSGYDDGFVSYARVGRVEFPEPNGRNVNMLPFIFGDKDSLPGDLQCYFPLIEQCPYLLEDVGKVGYLTVHESYVDVGKAQRREGLHIESPGISPDGIDASFTPAKEHCWGMGMFYDLDRYDGGIFIASSVSNTSEVWNALVDSRVPGIVDRHGGCEHLRDLIGQGTQLEAGELVWMTDLTPHEALPQKESGFRTFFRVVTPNVSHWYAEHSTANPKVPVPSNVTIVFGNKFA